MLVVADANELFSLLIKGSKESREIFFSNEIELIAPEFILTEFSKHKNEILLKTHKSDLEFFEMLSVIEGRIKLIPEEEFKELIESASKLLLEHTKDVPYFALALKFKCPIWSEERLLKTQSEVDVFNSRELSRFLSSEK